MSVEAHNINIDRGDEVQFQIWKCTVLGSKWSPEGRELFRLGILDELAPVIVDDVKVEEMWLLKKFVPKESVLLKNPFPKQKPLG